MHRAHQRRNQTSPRRETESLGSGEAENATATAARRGTSPALYDGAIYDGEYGDGDTIGLTLEAGKRGSGKTFRAWEKIQLCRHRVIIFDTVEQYNAEKGYDLRGWKIVHQPGELKQLLARSIHADKLKVIYKPLSGDKEIHFRAVTRMVLNYGKAGRGVIYLVDEIDKFCDPHTPLKQACPPLYDLVEYGRHFKVSGVFTTRRPYAVSRSLTAQCATLIIFRTTEPRDLKYFEQFLGVHVHKLEQLGKFQYLYYIDDAHVEPEIRGGPKKRGAIHDNEPAPR